MIAVIADMIDSNNIYTYCSYFLPSNTGIANNNSSVSLAQYKSKIAPLNVLFKVIKFDEFNNLSHVIFDRNIVRM